MTIISTDTKYVVVGLGLTGISCVRYLCAQGKRVSVVDSRTNPPGLEQLKRDCAQVEYHMGGFSESVILNATKLVMSPGVPLATPVIQKAINQGVEITSDIEFFLNEFDGQVVAITGSNAKSTVTQWLGDALKNGGQKVLVAGNIGLPVLDAIGQPYDIAVLEVSSFQLELISKLSADFATILNISEDHMDRYPSMIEYHLAKQKIYSGAKYVLVNRDDMLTSALVPDSVVVRSFGNSKPDINDYGILELPEGAFLAKGTDPVVKVSDISLKGMHNALNALVVLALSDAIGNDRESTLETLKNFKGLPYRCQLIKESAVGVRYFNDSKATNVGSTVAALTGLHNGADKKIILLLGGQSKDQELSPLRQVVIESCKLVFAFGEDKHLFKDLIPQSIVVDTMVDALNEAQKNAVGGDVVLLSPACASFDQFKNFEHRGEVFNQWLEGIA